MLWLGTQGHEEGAIAGVVVGVVVGPAGIGVDVGDLLVAEGDLVVRDEVGVNVGVVVGVIAE